MLTLSEQDEKARDSRLRRIARQQGLRLVKSRSRNPLAIDYGGYMIVDAASNVVLAGELNTPMAMSLDAVERYLTED